jgi:hypothetical protein
MQSYAKKEEPNAVTNLGTYHILFFPEGNDFIIMNVLSNNPNRGHILNWEIKATYFDSLKKFVVAQKQFFKKIPACCENIHKQ